MRPLLPLAAALVALGALALPPTDAALADPGYDAALLRWRGADGLFDNWEKVGTLRTAEGFLSLDPASAQATADHAGAYEGRNFYNGGPYVVGEATSPLTNVGFGFSRLVPSWNADTPPGTWIEVLARVQRAGRLTAYYNLGVWAADDSTVARHSVKCQRDGDGTVAVDTLVLAGDQPPADAVQVKVRLFSARPAEAVPTVRLVYAAVSTPAARPAASPPGDPSRWNKVIEVPGCSQQAYDDGGEVWCSPTSTSMVLGYWAKDTGPCEPRVRAAVAGVYDWVFDGHGNWPFNTAYAATQGLESYVTRLTSLAQAEEWIAAGIPLVLSYSWTDGALGNAPVPSSEGHLGVLVGFDAAGDPVMNDPASPTDGQVRRTYNRAQFEALWLEHSGGTAYVMHPTGHAPPLG